MSRRPDHIPPRKAWPAHVVAAVRDRSGGCCEAEGCDAKAVEIDHIVPVALGGRSEFSNAQHLCAACHRLKSDDDVAGIAKADRAGGRTGQYARRQKAKAEGRHRPIQGKGFDKTLTKGFDGQVRPRRVK